MSNTKNVGMFKVRTHDLVSEVDGILKRAD